MKILYFAWMRDHIGTSRETRPLPQGVSTVAGLVQHLRQQSPGHARALSDMAVVRVAVNQVYGDENSPLSEGDEVAFFPPVTGG